MPWLREHLTFPFTLKRVEDEDDAYFTKVAKKKPFRLGHQMEVLEVLDELDGRLGIMVKVREQGQIGSVPLADCEVLEKSDPNFYPVREYVVWSANR